jgi:hypothetical protein
VAPIATRYDISNHRRGDAEFTSELRPLSSRPGVSRQDVKGNRFGQFGPPVRGSFVTSIASLTNTVSGVVSVRSGKEMPRIAALPVVAAVEHEGLVIGDVAMFQEVGDTVDEGESSPAFPDAAAPSRKHAVAASIGIASEFPAIVKSAAVIDVQQKSLNLLWGNINMHFRLRSDVPRRRVFLAPLRLSVWSIIPAAVRV